MWRSSAEWNPELRPIRWTKRLISCCGHCGAGTRPDCPRLALFPQARSGSSDRNPMNAEELAVLICRSLERAPAVEMERLATFVRAEAGRIWFQDSHRPRVLVACAVQEVAHVARLHAR